MKCLNCGSDVKKTEKYCSYCGKKIEVNFEELEPVNVEKNNNNGSISLTLGIIACVFFWCPILAIPLGIVSIIVGRFYKKETGKKTVGSILGIVGLVLSILMILLVVIFLILIFKYVNDNIDFDEGSITIGDDVIDFDDYFDGKVFGKTIEGYSWQGNDKSILYLEEDGDFDWYLNDYNKQDNYYEGDYELYRGSMAIDYISNNLSKYGITEQEQRDLITRNEKYTLNNYYLLILKPDKAIIDGKYIARNDKTYYYGFYNEELKYLDLVNMDTASNVGFTRVGKID